MVVAGGEKPRVAILPGVGASHSTPFIQLAKLLVLHHGFSVTIITISSAASPPKSDPSFVESLPAGVDFLALPPADVPGDLDFIKMILLSVTHSLPALRTALSHLKLSGGLVAFVTDPFCGDALDIAKDVGVPSFLFVTSNLFTVSLALHMPSIYAAAPDLPDVIELPGCVPLRRRDFPDPMKDVSIDLFQLFMSNVNRYAEPQGIMVNSFQELEPGPAEYFSRKDTGWPPVYLVGPLLGDMGSKSPAEERAECLRWLDEQPVDSVLYISFGSRAMLTHSQTTEMAHGLEMSGQRFLWVIRCPLDSLPEGFLERTKKVGFVLPTWAPQLEILSHNSTGGFLSHCGWNSTMESVVNGVAMIAWPICAEQELNAAYLVEGARVALRAEKAEEGMAKRGEVARAVKELMEGEGGREARDNVRKLQKAAAKTLAEGGSSYRDLSELANSWKLKLSTT